jgi:hypothetical protein
MSAPRIALVWSKGDGGFPRLVTDHPDLEVFNIDETLPDDRTYLLGIGVDRVSPKAFEELLGPVIHQSGEAPAVEPATVTPLTRKGGKSHLRLVEETEVFEGGKPLG